MNMDKKILISVALICLSITVNTRADSVVETFNWLTNTGTQHQDHKSGLYRVRVSKSSNSPVYTTIFTYRSDNDIVENSGDCFSYNTQRESVTDSNCTYSSRFNESYKSVMTSTNNWAMFDIGEDSRSAKGKALVEIELKHAQVNNDPGIPDFVIHPLHIEDKYVVVKSWDGQKKLTLELTEPTTSIWSGQFYIEFKGQVKTNGDEYGNYEEDDLSQHPLFIFASALPDWYYELGVNDNYNGCPPAGTSVNPQGDSFYTDPNWTTGKVVNMSGSTSTFNPDYILPTDDLQKRHVCIPGGVYLKGRFIFSRDHHGNNGSEDIKNVKIVGRGILSGIGVKHNESAGRRGSLIDIDNYAEIYNSIAAVNDDCYTRSWGINCIQGITLTDSPLVSILSNSRMDVQNVKMMGWHESGDGLSVGRASRVKDVFVKVNDDAIHMKRSYMDIKNITAWKQSAGSVINLGWQNSDTVESSSLVGLFVIGYDEKPSNGDNNNSSIIAHRNMMGGELKDFSLAEIVIEEAPYQIVNLQLDDKKSWPENDRCLVYTASGIPKCKLDGTGSIIDITINGLFTPTPYDLANRKSVFSLEDETIPGPNTTRRIQNILLKNICIGGILSGSPTAQILSKNVGTTNLTHRRIHPINIFDFEAGAAQWNMLTETDPNLEPIPNTNLSDPNNWRCTYKQFKTI